MDWGPKIKHPVPLLSEAVSLLEIRLVTASTAQAKIDAMVRSVRASLVSKKPDGVNSLYSFMTNCIGSVYWLGRAAEDHGLLVEPAIVVRYPWQEPAACREIHLAGIVKDSESSEVIVGDAMPEASYAFGTTSSGIRLRNNVVVRDVVLQRDVLYRILTPDEFGMIVQIFQAEALPSANHAIEKLWEAYYSLEDVPSYRIRALWKLSRYTSQEREALKLLSKQSPYAMRQSYAAALPGKINKQVLRFRTAQRQCQQDMLPLVEQALAQAATVDARNYWLAVQRVFSGDTLTNNNYNPRAYAMSGYKYPVYAYEREISMWGYRTRYAEAKSNLYTCDWLEVPDIK